MALFCNKSELEDNNYFCDAFLCRTAKFFMQNNVLSENKKH